MKKFNIVSKFSYALIIISLISVSINSNAYAQADKLQEYFDKGMEAHRQGKNRDAIEYFEQVVDIDPDFAPVYNALGLAYNENGARLSDIIWFFKVAIELDPEYAEAYSNMCRIYSQAEKHEKAETACLKALEINPGLMNVKLSLAWIYLVGRSSPSAAIYYFEQVLDKVKDPKIYFGLGLAYAKNGDMAEALDTVTTLRGMGSDDLATQLEATLRVESPSEEADTSPASVLEKRADTIVGSTATGISSAPAPPPPAGGGMKIRLRGRLSSPGKKKEDKKHPGSL